MSKSIALLKKVGYLPKELQVHLQKHVKAIHLSIGEHIPDDWPTGTFIFFDNWWGYINVYVKERAKNVRLFTIKPITIYYLFPSDLIEIEKIPALKKAIDTVSFRFLLEECQRKTNLKFEHKKIKFLTSNFSTILKAPTKSLLEFLQQKTDDEKKSILSAKKKK